MSSHIDNYSRCIKDIARKYGLWTQDVKEILEAAGYFDICEAAKNLCREPISTYDMENMYEVLRKAGVWDE